MKHILATVLCLSSFVLVATTQQLGTIRATENVVTSESDPTVPIWAKAENPPESMTDNALVLTNGTVKTKDGSSTVTASTIGAISTEDDPQYNADKQNLCTVAAAQAMTNEVLSKSSGIRNGSITWSDTGAFDELLLKNASLDISNGDIYNTGDLYISGTINSIWLESRLSETNVGAKAYADATFLKSSDSTWTPSSGYANIQWEEVYPTFRGLSVGSSAGFYGGVFAGNSWRSFCIDGQALPDYLASTEWHGNDKSLTDYGITDAYTKEEIDGTTVTNGGAVASAKAYADATFRTKTDNVCHADSLSNWYVISGSVDVMDTQPRWEESGVFWYWDVPELQRFLSFEGKSATVLNFIEQSVEQRRFSATRKTLATSGQPFVTADNVPSTNGLVSAQSAANIAEAMVLPVSNRVDYLEGYIAGQRIRVSVTNYYGNTSGELPRLRIEEFVTATNVVDGVATETNYWQIVWDEQHKYDRFMSEAQTAISAMTNNLYQTYYQLLQERLATKAPRAWGTLTSAGEAAPPGSVWHTEPNTVFAGGTEYAHAMVGTGVIGVLSSKGAAVYTDGETGRFHFTTDDKTAYFGMNIASRYELGCATDGITVTSVGANNMVDLLYNVTMSGKPVLYYTPTLQGNVTWEQITDSAGGSIPGATVYASWDQSPPAGSEICTINCGASLSGFFKASVEYAGTSKFETNMMADLAGGIVATNVTSGQSQPIEAIITNGIPIWRIKQ